jgi:hypothetical protein
MCYVWRMLGPTLPNAASPVFLWKNSRWGLEEMCERVSGGDVRYRGEGEEGGDGNGIGVGVGGGWREVGSWGEGIPATLRSASSESLLERMRSCRSCCFRRHKGTNSSASAGTGLAHADTGHESNGNVSVLVDMGDACMELSRCSYPEWIWATRDS